MAIGIVYEAKVSSKGWIVIPALLRKKYNLRPGSTVGILDTGEQLILFPGMKDPVEESYGMLAGRESLTQALLEERAKEREREERKSLRTG